MKKPTGTLLTVSNLMLFFLACAIIASIIIVILKVRSSNGEENPLTVKASGTEITAQSIVAASKGTGTAYLEDYQGNPFEIKYKLTGDENDPILVLAAGLGAGTSSWMILEPTLSSKYRVLSYNPRCMYDSTCPIPYEENYPFDEMANDLKRLLDYLELDPSHGKTVNVLGWSMGGCFTQDFAARYPEYVDKVILMTTAPLGSDEVLDEFNEYMQEHTNVPEDPTPEEMEVYMTGIIGLSFNSELLGNLMEQASGLLTTMYPHYYEGLVQQMNALDGAEVYNELPDITAPVLLLHGTKDELVPMMARDLIAANLTGSDEVVIKDIYFGSHTLGMENVFQTSWRIKNFLK